MKILFLMLNLSDLGKPAGMYSDLITEFIRNGHDVYPVASALKNGKTSISTENNIRVLRVKTLPLFNVSPTLKGIANVMLPWQYKNAINRFYKDVHPDLIIIPTPPVTLGSLAKSLKKKYKSGVYLVLRDIFPQNAVDLGLIQKGGIMHRFFRRQEKNLYRISDSIGCMSQGNIDYFLKHNPETDKKKLHILMNFQKSSESDSGVSENLKEKYGLNNKFVVVFGGNMGVPQKIENVIYLAKECLVFDDVIFLFIGEGTQRKRIENLAGNSNVSNIVFKDFIQRDEYLQLIRQCDAGLISLNERYTIPNIPSKTMSYFDAGIPVLASVDSATDYGKILETAGAGLVSRAGDTKSFFNNFCKLYNSRDLRIQMGKNGNTFFRENMTSEIAYRTIMEHVQEFY
ncbi:MAG: glycosyltransferase WbuB [Odoribacter sp.]|nr:glycosyltransferase WbuB [Odoribacter sp.]